MEQTIPVVDLNEYLEGGSARDRFVAKMSGLPASSSAGICAIVAASLSSGFSGS
jgi:hypothetical protein